MNNKPVAWMVTVENDTEFFIDEKLSKKHAIFHKVDAIPLYTHPVKEPTDDPLANFKPVWQEVLAIKELTDEEIHDLIVNKVTDYDMIKKALRKAQENDRI
jgi:hypothetical protein